MLAKDVEIGGVYVVRWHDGSFTEVQITAETRYPIYGGYPYRQTGSKTRWSARNLKTDRAITIKSAAKLRSRVR